MIFRKKKGFSKKVISEFQEKMINLLRSKEIPIYWKVFENLSGGSGSLGYLKCRAHGTQHPKSIKVPKPKFEICLRLNL